MKLRRVFNSTTSTIVMIFILKIAHLNAWHDPLDHVNEPLEVKVGVILDMESSLGKRIYGCIAMAVSDFYKHNVRYMTKIVLHTRDSKGEPLSAFSAALDLVENIKVHAIIGPETSHSSKLLTILTNKAKIPILSFAPSSSSYVVDYPFFLRIAPDQTTQFKAMATVLEYYKWRHIIYIYEDTDCGRDTISYMVDFLQEKDIEVIYKFAISPLATGDKIFDQLHKLIGMSTTTFVVHVSPSLASRLFSKAMRLGMMDEGHSWFLTDKTMNFFDSLDAKTVKSLKGVLGLKPFIPASKKLRNFTLRWRNYQQARNATLILEPNEYLNVFGMWSYDATWALAKAVEKVGLDILTMKEKGPRFNLTNLANIKESPCGRELLDKILETKFEGLSGEFRLANGHLFSNAFEIVNVIGKYEVTIGFWTLSNGLTRENNLSAQPVYGLEAVIWPGGSTSIPRGRVRKQSNKKLKIGVPMKSGFHELLKYEYSPEIGASFSGYCIDVFNLAIKSLHYEVSYDFIPHSGTYTDLLDQVYFKNFDAAVGDITITSNRSSYVDFTTTFTDVGVGTIAKTTNRGKWFFLEPLDADLWLTIVGLFISMVIVIGAIEYHVNEEIQGLTAKKFGTVLWLSLLVLVFAHSDKLKGNLSKVLATGWTLVLLILISSYTAILSSVLTVQQIQIASRNSIGYRRSDIVLGAVINNINYTDGRLKPYRSPDEFARDLSLGSKHGGFTVIVDEIPYIKVFLAKYSRGYSMIGSEKKTNGFGFAFQKDSPLVSDISAAIQKFREDGTLLMLEKKWFRKILLMEQDNTSKPTTLSIDDFRFVFVVMAVLLVLVVLVLVYWIYKNTIVPRYIYLCDGNDEMAT